MRPLSPPLSVIENNLFSPSEDLINRWIAGDTTLSRNTVAALEKNAVALAYRRLPEESSSQEAATSEYKPVKLPARLQEIIEQRVTNSAHRFSAKPKAGQILRVDEAIGPQGHLNWDMSYPLAVAIAEPTEHPDIWYGWLVSHETDYAGYWDMLLDEADEPYDPLARMIQLWNPVHVYIPSTSAVLAELGSERLAALRSMAKDFLTGPRPDPAKSRAGSLLERRTQDGFRVMTGTPLGKVKEDPRWRYQELYFAAAAMLKEPAKLALAEPSLLKKLWQDFKGTVGNWGLTLEPVPSSSLGQVPAMTMGNATEIASERYELGNLLTVQLFLESEETVIRVHVALLAATPLKLKVVKAGRDRQQAKLTADSREADLYLEMGLDLVWIVEDSQGAVLFRWELPE